MELLKAVTTATQDIVLFSCGRIYEAGKSSRNGKILMNSACETRPPQKSSYWWRPGIGSGLEQTVLLQLIGLVICEDGLKIKIILTNQS